MILMNDQLAKKIYEFFENLFKNNSVYWIINLNDIDNQLKLILRSIST